jgi:hypothetical protein
LFNGLPFLGHIFAILHLLLALRGVNLRSTPVLIIKHPENINQIPILISLQIEITKGKKFVTPLGYKKAIKIHQHKRAFGIASSFDTRRDRFSSLVPNCLFVSSQL